MASMSGVALAQSSEAPLQELAEDWTVQVTADQVSLVDGRAQGEGEVHIQLEERAAWADRFVYHSEEGVLELWEGRWPTDHGEVRFSHARINVRLATGLMFQARWTASDGGMRVSGDQVRVVDGQTLQGEGVQFTGCGCDRPPWSVSARQVTVVLDEVAHVRSGWIRVCGAPLVPVPVGSFALSDRRSGLLLPSVGLGRDGWAVSEPVMLVLGPHADLVLEPEWRQFRGFRGLATGRLGLAPDEGLEARGAGGWDQRRGVWRGISDVQHGWAPGPLRSGLRSRWTSDPDYLDTYGGSFLARRSPWNETQGVLGLGPVQLESLGFQVDPAGEAVVQQPLSGVIRTAGAHVGPVAWGGSARLDLAQSGVSPWAASDARMGRGAADLHARTAKDLGPVRFVGQGRAEGRSWNDGSPWGLAGGGAEARLLWWGDGGLARALGDVGVAAEAVGVAGVPDVRTPDDEAPQSFALGPVAQTRVLTARGVPLSLEGRVPWTPDGWLPWGRVLLRARPWTAAVSADSVVQAGRVGRDDGITSIGLGLAHTQVGVLPGQPDPLLQATGRVGWWLPGVLSEFRPGWGGLYDLPQGALLAHGPSLGFKSRCDCLSATAGATWSADRDGPEVQLQLRVD